MATVQIGIGMVGITGYLLVNVRYASDPTVVAASQNFPGPQPSNRNIVFTGLNAEPAFFDYRESPDGVALGVLLVIYEVDIVNNRIISEKRFYKGGGPRPIDPVAGQNQLIDPYLDGVNISGVFQEGYRFLEPLTEYTLIAGGGVQLENGRNYSDGETFSIDIDYSQALPPSVSGNPYKKVTEVTTNTTLSSTQKNGRVRCKGSGSRLVLTLPVISSLLDGDYFYLTTQNGSQIQTKIISQGSDTIILNGTTWQEFTLGKGEAAWIEKQGSSFEIITEVPGMLHVGERFAGTSLLHPNTLPENGQLIDGDDYPRIYQWVIAQPVNNWVSALESSITSGGFAHDAGKEGLFYVSNTSKKMRMPNTQSWTERGLQKFVGLGSDTTRTYDFPGGSQPEQVGPHQHPADDVQTGGVNDPLKLFVKRKVGVTGGGLGLNATGGGYESASQLTGKNIIAGGAISNENRVRNIGVVYLRRV